MISLLFRKANLTDLEAIVQLLADDALGSQREQPADIMHSPYKEAFDQILADPNQFLMVVEQQEKVIGTCHLTLMPSFDFSRRTAHEY